MKKKLVIIILIAITTSVLLFCVFSGKIKTKGSAELSWNPNAETDIAGYRIYYGTTERNGDCPPGGYTDNIDVGNTIKYKISNLKPGKTYYFSVTSYDSSGKESCFSEEMKKRLESPLFAKIKSVFKK